MEVQLARLSKRELANVRACIDGLSETTPRATVGRQNVPAKTVIADIFVDGALSVGHSAAGQDVYSVVEDQSTDSNFIVHLYQVQSSGLRGRSFHV